MTSSTRSSGVSVLQPSRISRAAWYTLIILTLVYVSNAIDRSAMSIVIEPIKHEFHLSDSQLGLLTGLAFGLTYALMGIPMGMLVDRVSRRNLMVVMLTVWSGFTFVCGVAGNYLQLVTARLAVGASESAAAPTALSIIADIFPRHRRSTAIGVFWASTAVGTAISLILGGVIAVRYGWRATFFVAGVPGLILALLLLLTVKEPAREGSAREAAVKAPSLWRTARYVAKAPVVFHAFAGIGLNSIAMSGVPVWVASFLVRTQHFNLAQAGLLGGIGVGVFGVLGSLAGGPLGDQLVKRRGMGALPLAPFIASALAVLFGLVFALGGQLVWVILGFIGFEVVSRAHTAPAYNLLVAGVEPRMRGVVISTTQAVTNLVGYGVGPLIVGVVSDRVGGGKDSLKLGVAAVMLFCAWAALHFFLAWRASRKSAAMTADFGV